MMQRLFSNPPATANATQNSVSPVYGFVLSVEPLAAAYLSAWRQYLHGQGAHFFQTPPWFQCLVTDRQGLLLLTTCADKIVASSVIRRRRVPVIGWSIYSVERGPVCHDTDILVVHLHQLVEVLRDDAVGIRVSPFYVDDKAAAVETLLRQGGWTPVGETSHLYDTTLVIDLRREVEAIRAGLRRSMRTQLNKATRLGLRIRDDAGPQEFSIFVQHYNEMARRRGLALITKQAAGALSNLIGQSEGVTLFIAEYQDVIVAGALLIPSGDRIIYRWGFTSEATEHRQLPLSHALHWEAILWARSAGYAYYDFGGYWEQRGDSDPINRFKSGFSNDKQHLVREHVMIIRPSWAILLAYAARVRKWFS